MRDTFYLPTDKILLDFKKYLTNKGFSKPSVSYYLSDARVFLATLTDQSPLVFNEAVIRSYLASLSVNNVNKQTIKRKTTALKHLQVFLVENGFLLPTTRGGSGIVNPQLLLTAITSGITGAALAALIVVLVTQQTSPVRISGNTILKTIDRVALDVQDNQQDGVITVTDQSPFQVNIDTEDQSSGRAIVKANQTFVDVYGNVEEDDLVFISPVTLVAGISSAVTQVTNGYFRIEISTRSKEDTVVNWHIVKKDNDEKDHF
ncbi:site-specific integrase [Candidatus Woesebacteria bacterium]|nr:site-specific integrase [Candidatus Woesebacteria bacterium]